ncbi:Crp/Fnr family transcriptional regulator [Sphingomonas qomolangmaensis]|uniref:Crp/Fnr family transcriptional regulator n=1 Tax=Sphingomonas qomolangmaensis TaxID=2918765 RepID=A0ABY5L6R7_9SPHN|nr:Crp/Fnr family transcriptional regulator [Sphingomonas qomolangmaensis]UUL82132.1 Crp/Fnr family transcriptional regulator [Sphingomonas qomolangmaensis]
MSAHIALTQNEIDALARLEERNRTLKRGSVLRRSSDSGNELFVLRKGCMMTYVILGDGARQILRFHFPGDMLGLSSILYEEAPETICALSECVVCPFEKSGLSELVETHPRLAAMILVYGQIERIALTDRLAALGRTSAKARVGSLLLELRNRLRAADREIGDSFALGLTQEEIGDATGLTAVHVNRMLRQLEEEGMIARTGGRVTIRDEIALTAASNYVDRHRGLDLAWLPKGR